MHCSNGEIYINGVRVNDINAALYDRETWAKILEIMRRGFTCRHEARHSFNDLTRQGLLYCVRQGL
jgi:hypothetical protein